MVHLTLAIGRFFDILLGALLGAAAMVVLYVMVGLAVVAALGLGARAIWRAARRADR